MGLTRRVCGAESVEVDLGGGDRREKCEGPRCPGGREGGQGGSMGRTTAALLLVNLLQTRNKRQDEPRLVKRRVSVDEAPQTCPQG